MKLPVKWTCYILSFTWVKVGLSSCMISTNTTVKSNLLYIHPLYCIYRVITTEVAYLYIHLYLVNVCSRIQQMANIFYQKLKCLLSVASKVYLIKLILRCIWIKKSNLLLGFVKLLLYFCTESWISLQKCTMCGRVLSSWYRGEFATSKSRQIHVMCVKALSAMTHIARFFYCAIFSL